MSATGNYAPIVLFVYNRPEHTRRTVEALRQGGAAAYSLSPIFDGSFCRERLQGEPIEKGSR